MQDPFCRSGSFDPVEALGLAALVAQLDEPFDAWSDTICRAGWLDRGRPGMPSLVAIGRFPREAALPRDGLGQRALEGSGHGGLRGAGLG